MTKKIVISVLAAALISCAAAYAHNGATGIVKQRMDAMGVLAKATKSLAETFRGKVPYDAQIVRQNARQIRQHAGESLTRLYPAGSLMKPSEASPSIWSDWEQFSVLAGQLEALAVGLEASADNGMRTSGSPSVSLMKTGEDRQEYVARLAAMPVDDVFGMVARTCASCHAKFRIKNH